MSHLVSGVLDHSEQEVLASYRLAEVQAQEDLKRLEARLKTAAADAERRLQEVCGVGSRPALLGAVLDCFVMLLFPTSFLATPSQSRPTAHCVLHRLSARLIAPLIQCC